MSLYDHKDDPEALLAAIRVNAALVAVPDGVPDGDITESYRLARALDPFLTSYFADEDIPTPSVVAVNRGIDSILGRCYDELSETLGRVQREYNANEREAVNSYVNLFEAARAQNLFLSNKYNRVITENLGHKFEEIASLSRKTYNPEDELGLTIRGVDIVIGDNHQIRYTQMKTKRDTLTGSQSPRSNAELGAHPHSIFAAALDLGKGWTFGNRADNLNAVTRLTGEAFWGKIDIDYSTLLQKCKDLMLRIEGTLYAN